MIQGLMNDHDYGKETKPIWPYTNVVFGEVIEEFEKLGKRFRTNWFASTKKEPVGVLENEAKTEHVGRQCLICPEPR